MNHLAVDHARAVHTERLRQAQPSPPPDHRTNTDLDSNRRSTMRHGIKVTGLSQVAGVMAIAALAFVTAFGGTAWAAKVITGKQVKDGSLSTADVRSVTGDDVGDESLTDADFAELVSGPKGPRGQEGPSGFRGPQGPPGSSGLTYVVRSMDVPKGATRTWSAPCAGAQTVIGGGLSSGSPSWFLLVASAPDITGDSWAVTAKNTRDVALTAYAWATCISAS